MNFEVEGTLHKVFPIESKSGTFQTREFVITSDGQYVQYIKFQAVQDRCGIVDNFKEGERVKVYFDLRGREWQGKYFTNLNAWRVEKVAANAPQNNATNDSLNEPPRFSEYSSFESSSPTFSGDDDLPF